MTPLASFLLVAALLFSIGLAGALTRHNAILVLIGIELMLNAANLNLIAFWRYGPHLRFFQSPWPRPKQRLGWV
jgi:NADH-quinone oxidoreductase subunit K